MFARFLKPLGWTAQALAFLSAALVINAAAIQAQAPQTPAAEPATPAETPAAAPATTAPAATAAESTPAPAQTSGAISLSVQPPAPPAPAAEPIIAPAPDAPAPPPPPAPPPMFKPGLLLQAWGRTESVPRIERETGKVGDGLDTRTTFYMRRIRFMLSGQFSDLVNYFAETDSFNFGKYGDFTPNVIIQDAWMELNPAPQFQLDVGMLLLPFSHQGMQGATTLNAIDYHSKLMRYPAGGKVWRNVGLMVRGLLFSDVVEYRLALTTGIHKDRTSNPKDISVAAKPAVPATDSTPAIAAVDAYTYKNSVDPRNPKDWPRLTGRLTFNAFDAEGGPGVGGFFYKGLYLKETPDGIVSPKRVLAFGASIDWQKGANVTMKLPPTFKDKGTTRGVDEYKDYLGVNADAFWDMPLNAKKTMAISGQVAFYYYNHGDRSEGLSYYDLIANKDLFSGIGIASELGVRIHSIEPVISFDWYNSSKTKTPEGKDKLGDYMAVYGGINYFLAAHAVTFKLEVGAQKEPWSFTAKEPGSVAKVISKFAPFGTLQAQLLL